MNSRSEHRCPACGLATLATPNAYFVYRMNGQDTVILDQTCSVSCFKRIYREDNVRIQNASKASCLAYVAARTRANVTLEA